MNEQQMDAILECLNKNIDRFVEMQNSMIQKMDEEHKNRPSLKQMKEEWLVSMYGNKPLV